MLQANRAARLPRCSGAGGISRLKEKKRRKKPPKTTKKEKSAPRAHSRRGQGLGARRSGHVPGAAPGDLPAGVPHRTAPRRAAPRRAGHSPSWLPYPQWWDMVRGPAASAEAVAAPWPRRALRGFYRLPPTPCPSPRGRRKGWGARAGAEGDSAGGGESAPL